MAVEKSSLGLKKIEIADVPATGLPTAWVELEDAQIDSASLTEGEATFEDIYIEQQRDVYRRIETQAGALTFTVQLYDVGADVLNLLKGGTVVPATGTTGKKWKAPTETIQIVKAVRLTSLDDYKFVIPRGQVSALITFALAKSGLATITLTITATKPSDDTLSIVEVEEPMVPPTT